jgi:hypothetical protein
MTDSRLGRIGATVTGASVALFAVAMLVETFSELRTAMASYFVCIFIAVG